MHISQGNEFSNAILWCYTITKDQIFLGDLFLKCKNITPTAEGCTFSKRQSVVPQHVFCSCKPDHVLKDNHKAAMGLLLNALNFPYNAQEILFYNTCFKIGMEKPHDRCYNLGSKV